MQKERETTTCKEAFLKRLSELEDLGEKKMKIYSRLLMDTALAEDMQRLATRHENRKECLIKLWSGKPSKTKNEGGRYAMNDEEEEK
ncbi:MAG: hypothetical protein IJX87_04390 [Clostridia bacterium]|nr:hypothetical protein [Clostridia bacterium]